MAKYKKRADGLYCTHVTIGRKPDGKPQRKTVYAKTIKELEAKTAEIRRQVNTGTIIADDSVLLGDWAQEWLTTYKSDRSYNTQIMYQTIIDAHIIPNIGQMKLKAIRPFHVKKLINSKIDSGHIRTAQKIKLTINQIFKEAVENNLIIKNPAEKIETPRKENIEKRSLTAQEKKHIESADLDLKCRAFVSTLLYTGLRKGEALALMRNDVDLKNKTITVNKTLITKKNRPEIKASPKTDAGNRTIPIPDELVSILGDYLSTIKALYVFPSASAAIMSRRAFQRFWGKIYRRINIAAGGNRELTVIGSDITPHIFRHTYATMLYYAGVDVKTAQYLLGHANTQITMEIYTHLENEMVTNSVDKLNEYISRSRSVVNADY